MSLGSRIPISRRLDTPIAHLAVDLVLLAVVDGDLYVVMSEREEHPFRGDFVLPGMILEEGQLLEDAICSVLFDKVGDVDARPEQFFTFTDPARDPRGRVISVAYLALAPAEWLMRVTGPPLDAQLVKVRVEDASECALLYLEERVIDAAFDHDAIIAKAVRHLQARLDCSMLAFDVLHDDFTMLELQRVHEAILGRALSKPLFRKRMLGRTFADGRRLKATEETRGGAHRPAMLYTLS